MVPSKKPLAEYISRLLLLESIICFRKDDSEELKWLEETLSKMAQRWEELDKREKK